MKKLRFALLGAALAAVAVLPATAQDGEGLIIIEGNFGGDPASLNPITASDTASARIYGFLFPGFVSANPETATIEPNQPGAIVEDWEVSEDGLVYTFNLRQDLTWTDGTPITAADALYTWGAIQAGADGTVDTPRIFVLDAITSVEALDDYTIQVTFASADCTAVSYAASALQPVPAHILPADYSQLNADPFSLQPSVTSGVFNFSALNPGEQVALVRNEDYAFASEGMVMPEGFIYRVVPDQTVLVEQFLAGATNVIDGADVARRSDIAAAAEAGEVNVFNFPGNAWDYLALNYADPNNPQNAFDADGNPIDQGNHPLFGDVRVRQAISLALDVDAMVSAAVFGEGTRMNGSLVPASWAYDTDLPLIEFDPEAAVALLAEAGFEDTNGDGILEATENALYAEPGTPFTFSLYTNEGNGRRTAIGTLVQDQLAQIGVNVDFQTIDFNTLLDIMDSQTFDAFILGWRNGYPDDPDQTQLFATSSDVVGAGSNNVSWHNAEFDALQAEARAVPGCDPEVRSELYARGQEIFREELPYIPLFVINGQYAANSMIDGFAPYPSQLYWNVDTWTLATQ
jgi:peptide/nickel transport system substrate-binding protein